MMMGLEYLSHEERLRDLGLLSLEKGKLKEISSILINTGGHREDRARLFSVSVMPSDRGNGHPLNHSIFPLNSQKHFFPVTVAERSRLSREVVESPFLEIFRSCLELRQPAKGRPA